MGLNAYQMWKCSTQMLEDGYLHAQCYKRWYTTSSYYGLMFTELEIEVMVNELYSSNKVGRYVDSLVFGWIRRLAKINHIQLE